MALSFDQKPILNTDKIPVITNWNPVIGFMVYQSSSIAAFFYYKLVLETYIGPAITASMLIGKMKQRRNGAAADISSNKARAYFDLRDIVNSQLVDTIYDQNSSANKMKTIHKLGANDTDKPFSLNGDKMQTYGDGSTVKSQIVQITVKAYQHYADAADEAPTDRTSGSINNTAEDIWFMAASLPLFTARNTSSSYLQGTDFQVFQMSGNTKRFLSDVQQSSGDVVSGSVYRNYVQDTDYHTLGFLNGEDDFNSIARYIKVAYYDSAGAQIGSTQELSNREDNGGAIPNTSGTEVNSDVERLVYVGCGPANLEAQEEDTGARPSNFSGWAYYKIWAYDDTGAGAVRSADYYFIKQDGSCKGYKVRRLAWRNSLGCWDYFNFKKKSQQTINVERNTFSTMLGNFGEEKYSYADTQRGEKTRQTTATLEETLNTDWITEQDAQLLEGLIMSTNVEIVENADTEFSQGVMVTDSSFVRKTVANDKMIQYTIKIKYANNINTNS